MTLPAWPKTIEVWLHVGPDRRYNVGHVHDPRQIPQLLRDIAAEIEHQDGIRQRRGQNGQS